MDKSCFTKEIESAIKADKVNRKFPSLKFTARAIREGHFYEMLSSEELSLLADFLEGKHRGHKGYKSDKSQQRQDDIERVKLLESYLEKGDNKTKAMEKLAAREKLESPRSAQRAVKRGLKYIAEDAAREKREAEKRLMLAKIKEEIIKEKYISLRDLASPQALIPPLFNK